MYVPDRRAEDADVEFANVPPGWQIMLPNFPPGRTPNSFVAPSYDALVDAPVEAGKFDEFEFDSDGAPFPRRRRRRRIGTRTAWKMICAQSPPTNCS